MDLYLAAVQVVPMLFIALFLNQKNDTEEERDTLARLRFFHTTVALLGLLAFSLSVFVVGSQIAPPAWTGSIVTAALACAMAALGAQILLVLSKTKSRSSTRR